MVLRRNDLWCVVAEDDIEAEDDIGTVDDIRAVDDVGVS